MNFDKELIAAVRKSALGYEYEEREMIAGKNGSKEKMVIRVKYMPPCMRAAKLLMTIQRLENDNANESAAPM